MNQKRLVPFLIKLIVLAVPVLLPTTALADAPWYWKMSLRVEQTGDSMYMPSAVAFDKKNERYYAVDTGRNRLVSFDRDGKLLSAFTADERLQAPFDMVRLDNGKLWVVEKGRNSLTLIDVAARKVETHTLRDGKKLVFPDRLAANAGKLYVLDRASGQILRLDGDLNIEQRYGCPECSAGMFDFVIVNNSIVALEPRDKKVYRFNNDGTIVDVISLGEEVAFPISVAVGQYGFIYVLDRKQNSVLVYSENGQFLYRFLSQGQSVSNVFFPRELRFDPWGQLCVVDEGNGRIEIFSR